MFTPFASKWVPLTKVKLPWIGDTKSVWASILVDLGLRTLLVFRCYTTWNHISLSGLNVTFVASAFFDLFSALMIASHNPSQVTEAMALSSLQGIWSLRKRYRRTMHITSDWVAVMVLSQDWASYTQTNHFPSSFGVCVISIARVKVDCWYWGVFVVYYWLFSVYLHILGNDNSVSKKWWRKTKHFSSALLYL